MNDYNDSLMTEGNKKVDPMMKLLRQKELSGKIGMSFNALLLIDYQKDFCDPDGALYIPGAEEDCKRIARWIENNAENIDGIYFAMDWHHANSIFHPSWFVDENGKNPEPYTVITLKDMEEGKWRVSNLIADVYRNPQQISDVYTRNYLEILEEQNRTHIIWPYHAIANTKGSALQDDVANAITKWQLIPRSDNENIVLHSIKKGTSPFSEQYGALRPVVETVNLDLEENFDYENPENNKKTPLFLQEMVTNYDRIYVAGEAASHCVGETMTQITNDELVKGHNLQSKFVLFQDCITPVKGFEKEAEGFLQTMKEDGIKMSESTMEEPERKETVKKV